jgi:ethanolamine utilization protein EutQ (cupin superfamily)
MLTKIGALFFIICFIFVLLPNLAFTETAITIAEEQGYNNLDFSVTKTNILMCTVTEICTSAGYIVTLTAVNGTTTGLFIGYDIGNSETLSFTIKYDDVNVVLSGASAVVTDSDSPTSAEGVQKTLKISYTGTDLAADTYSDTISLEITAK